MRTIGRRFRRPEVRNIMDIAEDNSSIPSSSFQGTMIFDKKARQQQQQQQLLQHRCSIYSDGQWDKSVPRRYFQKYPSHNEQSGMTFLTLLDLFGLFRYFQLRIVLCLTFIDLFRSLEFSITSAFFHFELLCSIWA
jgi:hypothetical protein